jgi:pimeloyl-ACP methyl ester carboxylesterase
MSVRIGAVGVLAAVVGCSPPTALYETPHGTVNLPCVGSPSDAPTVVFLSAAGDAGHAQWWRMQDALSEPAHSCIFDPPGVGSAPAPAVPSTAEDVAAALTDALHQAGATGEWLFVAHAHGALHVRVLGRTHAERMHAAVFLDPMVPAFIPDQPQPLIDAFLDPQRVADQAAAVTSWSGDAPIFVHSHDRDQAVSVDGWTPEAQEAWTAGQQEYAALTTVGLQSDIPGTEHYLHREAPDVVLYTLEAARAYPEPPPSW